MLPGRRFLDIELVEAGHAAMYYTTVTRELFPAKNFLSVLLRVKACLPGESLLRPPLSSAFPIPSFLFTFLFLMFLNWGWDFF